MLNAKIVKIKELPKKAEMMNCQCGQLKFELYGDFSKPEGKRSLYIKCSECDYIGEIKQKKQSISKGRVRK